MKKVKNLFIVTIIISLGLILGGCKMEMKEDKTATKEEQIEFLKKHEDEMTEFVRAQNDIVASVKYNWNGMESETVGNGTPQGGGKILNLRITIYDKEGIDINAFGFAVEPNDIKNPTTIKTMYTINANYDYYPSKEDRVNGKSK